jgi:hypothetical protein
MVFENFATKVYSENKVLEIEFNNGENRIFDVSEYMNSNFFS